MNGLRRQVLADNLAQTKKAKKKKQNRVLGGKLAAARAAGKTKQTGE
jgi:hypothetical protein